jgi:hypothetical protein
MREVIGTVDEGLTMLRGAKRGMNGFSVSEIEIKRGGVSYSIDTIRISKRGLTMYFFLIRAFYALPKSKRGTDLPNSFPLRIHCKDRPACNAHPGV